MDVSRTFSGKRLRLVRLSKATTLRKRPLNFGILGGRLREVGLHLYFGISSSLKESAMKMRYQILNGKSICGPLLPVLSCHSVLAEITIKITQKRAIASSNYTEKGVK